MTCEKFEDLMIINLFGKLKSLEKEKFDEHLIACSGCASKFEQLKHRENIMENSEIPEPDWEKSWEIIFKKSVRKKNKPQKARNARRLISHVNFKKVFVPFVVYFKNEKKSALQKYGLSAAVLIMVFIAGFAIGRRFFVNQPASQLTSSGNFSDLSLQSFAEELEPILIDFLNRSDRPVPAEFDDFEKKIVTQMLVKTKLLKYIMQKNENPKLVQLLDEVEFILQNISNLRPEDSLSKKQIQKFIREKKLKYQIKLVANEKIVI